MSTPLAAAGSPESGLFWWAGRLVEGHGVASGRAADSPYPAGTIALQTPFFRAHGLDLSPYQPATLNLDFGAGCWQLRDPDHCLPHLRWTDRHPPETFSFWRCRLRLLAEPGAAGAMVPPSSATVLGEWSALIYYPHPETKRAHHHSPSRLEVLAPPLGSLRLGAWFAVGVNARRCRFQPAAPADAR